jgi:NHL repeat-containing protein
VPPSPERSISTWEPRVLAGSGEVGYRDGAASEAMFNAPAGVARAADGRIYVTDQRNHRVRAISPDGVVSTLAGCGPAGVSDGSFLDGTGEAACFNSPTGIVVGQDGLIYVADTGNHCIRAVTPQGSVTTFAGSVSATGSVDASNPTEAQFLEPRGLAVGPDGALYVADSGNEAVRRIDANGVTTVASKIPRASGVAVGADGTVYAVSASKGGIYVIENGGARLIAGSDLGDRDGPAAQALMRSEGAAIVDGEQLVFSDSGNYKLRGLTLSGTAQVVTLVGGDSPERRTLHLPRGLAWAPEGWIVVDAGHNRIVLVPRLTAGGHPQPGTGPISP